MPPRLLAALLAAALPLAAATSLAPAARAAGPVVDLDDPATVPLAESAVHDDYHGTAFHLSAGVNRNGRLGQAFTASADAEVDAVVLRLFADPLDATIKVRLYEQADWLEDRRLYEADDPLHADEPDHRPLATGYLPTSQVPAGERRARVDLAQPATVEAGRDYWLVVDVVDAVDDDSLVLAMEDEPRRPRAWTQNLTTHTLTGFFAIFFELRGPVPAVTVANDGPAGDAGWFTGPVTSTYRCADTLPACPSSVTTTTDGVHEPTGTFTVDGTAYDFRHEVRVDTAPPRVEGTVAGHEPGVGARVEWTCADDTSGVADCPTPTYVTGVGEDTVATAVARDVAGNTAEGRLEGVVAPAPTPGPGPVAGPRKRRSVIRARWATAPRTGRDGVPVVKADRPYRLMVGVRRPDGRPAERPPVLMRRVTTGPDGRAGTPKKVNKPFRRPTRTTLRKAGKRAWWTATLVFQHRNRGTHRKITIRAADGTTKTLLVRLR